MVDLSLDYSKRTIKDFLLNEEGKITKESLLKTGIFITGVALGSTIYSSEVSAAHANSLAAPVYNAQQGILTASHTHSTATSTSTSTGTGTYY